MQSPKPNLQPANEGGALVAAAQPAGAAWSFLPISLAKGLHRLRVTGVAAKSPTLDIRFGGRGAQSIGADFKHAQESLVVAPSGAASNALPRAMRAESP